MLAEGHENEGRGEHHELPNGLTKSSPATESHVPAEAETGSSRGALTLPFDVLLTAFGIYFVYQVTDRCCTHYIIRLQAGCLKLRTLTHNAKVCKCHFVLVEGTSWRRMQHLTSVVARDNMSSLAVRTGCPRKNDSNFSACY